MNSITSLRPPETPESERFDSRYVDRLRTGVHETEVHFAEYFTHALNRTLRRQLRCPALLDDVRQETLARVLMSIRRGQLQNPERLLMFVMGVCRRVLYEYIRQQHGMIHEPLDAERLADEHHQPDADVISAERQQWVKAVLSQLSCRDRQILSLVYIDDLSRTDISRHLGIQRKGLRLLLHRAKSRFRSAAFATHRAHVEGRS